MLSLGPAIAVVAFTLPALAFCQPVATITSGEPPPYARPVSASVYIKVQRIWRNQLLPTSGSGLFVSPRGHILTNWHVVAPQIEFEMDGITREISTTSGAINVVLGSGTSVERTLVAKVVTLDRKRDLALLQVPMTPPEWIEVSPPGSVHLADPVWVIGYPFGDLLALNNKNPEVTVSSGRVTSIRHDEQGEVEALQIDAAVNPGNSGGPLLDAHGAVIGVIWSGVAGGNATSLAIAPERVGGFIHDNQVKVRVEPDAVYSRSLPLRLEIASGLADVDGLRCEASLSGTDIVPTATALEAVPGRCSGEMTIPSPRVGATTPESYLLTLRLLDAHNTSRLERTYKLPLREALPSRVRSDRPPGDMMRDRKELPNAVETSHLKRDDPDPPPASSTPGVRDDRTAALSRLAKNVKLRKAGDGPMTIDDQSLYEAGFVPDSASYAALPIDELRGLAQGYDQAEFELRRVKEAISDVNRGQDPANWSTRSYYYYRTYSPVELERMKKRLTDRRGSLVLELEDRLLRIHQEKLCRCRSGAWSIRKEQAKCVPCEAPQIEEQ